MLAVFLMLQQHGLMLLKHHDMVRLLQLCLLLLDVERLADLAASQCGPRVVMCIQA